MESSLTVRVSDYVLGELGLEARSRGRTSRAFFTRPRADAGAVRRPPYYGDEAGSCVVGVPASDNAMAGLRVPAAGETREQGCAVCLEDFEGAGGGGGGGGGGRLRTMPCSHSFHQDCIFRWLRVSRVCPCCRFPLPAALRRRAARPGRAGGGWLRRSRSWSQLMTY